MFDTLAVARDQAEVIAKALQDGVKQGDHVTLDQFKASLAAVRTEIANLDKRLSRQNRESRIQAHPVYGRNRHCHRHIDRWDPALHRVGEDMDSPLSRVARHQD